MLKYMSFSVADPVVVRADMPPVSDAVVCADSLVPE
jgi:hypothetical protein